MNGDQYAISMSGRTSSAVTSCRFMLLRTNALFIASRRLSCESGPLAIAICVCLRFSAACDADEEGSDGVSVVSVSRMCKARCVADLDAARCGGGCSFEATTELCLALGVAEAAGGTSVKNDTRLGDVSFDGAVAVDTTLVRLGKSDVENDRRLELSTTAAGGMDATDADASVPAAAPASRRLRFGEIALMRCVGAGVDDDASAVVMRGVRASTTEVARRGSVVLMARSSIAADDDVRVEVCGKPVDATAARFRPVVGLRLELFVLATSGKRSAGGAFHVRRGTGCADCGRDVSATA